MEEKNVTIPNEDFDEGFSKGYACAQEWVEKFIKVQATATDAIGISDIVTLLEEKSPVSFITTLNPARDLCSLIERIRKQGPPRNRELLAILENILQLMEEDKGEQS